MLGAASTTLAVNTTDWPTAAEAGDALSVVKVGCAARSIRSSSNSMPSLRRAIGFRFDRRAERTNERQNFRKFTVTSRIVPGVQLAHRRSAPIGSRHTPLSGCPNYSQCNSSVGECTQPAGVVTALPCRPPNENRSPFLPAWGAGGNRDAAQGHQGSSSLASCWQSPRIVNQKRNVFSDIGLPESGVTAGGAAGDWPLSGPTKVIRRCEVARARWSGPRSSRVIRSKTSDHRPSSCCRKSRMLGYHADSLPSPPPTPVGLRRQGQPHRHVQRPRQMPQGRVDADHQVKALHQRGRVQEGRVRAVEGSFGYLTMANGRPGHQVARFRGPAAD